MARSIMVLAVIGAGARNQRLDAVGLGGFFAVDQRAANGDDLVIIIGRVRQHKAPDRSGGSGRCRLAACPAAPGDMRRATARQGDRRATGSWNWRAVQRSKRSLSRSRGERWVRGRRSCNAVFAMNPCSPLTRSRGTTLRIARAIRLSPQERGEVKGHPAFSVIPPSTTSSIPVTYLRLVGGQEQRRVGDVPGIAHVPHRHLRVTRAPHRLDVALGIACRKPRRMLDHRRFHQARQNGVHPDMVGANSRRWCASSGSSRPLSWHR